MKHLLFFFALCMLSAAMVPHERVSYGSAAQTMNTTESRFSPDAPPFQSKIHSGLINNSEAQIVEQDATPSTSSGDYGLVNDFSQMTITEPSDEQTNEDLGLTAANYYVSMLTREQRNVLRSIRPAVLYAFLVEVAKVRSERQRRFVIDECAFCKNNGENEEFYLSHVLKDSRGRVLCPVLRAFRCPRCGATGDRAHTIKYCPQRSDVLDRNGCFPRRYGPPSPPSVNLGLGRTAEARRFVGVSTTEESLARPAPENADDWFGTIGLI